MNAMTQYCSHSLGGYGDAPSSSLSTLLAIIMSAVLMTSCTALSLSL